MRDRNQCFYYPDFVADLATLMRAILLFDEIHMMDRQCFQFGEGMGPRINRIQSRLCAKSNNRSGMKESLSMSIMLPAATSPRSGMRRSH